MTASPLPGHDPRTLCPDSLSTRGTSSRHRSGPFTIQHRDGPQLLRARPAVQPASLVACVPWRQQRRPRSHLTRQLRRICSTYIRRLQAWCHPRPAEPKLQCAPGRLGAESLVCRGAHHRRRDRPGISTRQGTQQRGAPADCSRRLERRRHPKRRRPVIEKSNCGR